MPEIVDLKKEEEMQPEENTIKGIPVVKKLLHPVGMLSTYIHHPDGVGFVQQYDNEEIILFLRRDFITNLPWIVITVLALFLPAAVYYFFNLASIPHSIFSTRFLVFLAAFYYIIVVGYAFANFASWFYNIGLVTTKRMIDIDFTNLSTIQVHATTLVEIDDVSYKQGGFFSSTFDYGTVIASTSGNKDNFVFDRVPRPVEAVNIISQLLGESK